MNATIKACLLIFSQAFASCAADAASLMPVWQNDTTANTLAFNDSFGHQVTIGSYNPATGAWSVGSGSISVGLTFTGGLISVAGSPVMGSGILALTLAGTPSGIPYFSSATTWASSAALSANQLMIGGGGGNPPATLGSLGTVTQVLHGNASGAPAFGPILTADLAGVTAFPGLTANVESLGTPGLDMVGCSGASNCGLTFYQAVGTPAAALLPALRLQRAATYTGGSVATVSTLNVMTTTSPFGAYYEWPILSNMANNTHISTGAQNVAIQATANKIKQSAVVTITNASPAVVTWTGSNFSANDIIQLTTTGTLPAPLAINTSYYVISAGLGANSFEISATQGGAAINTTTNGSGVHTAVVGIGPTWSMNAVCNDKTGFVDPPTSCVNEVDVYSAVGSGTDSLFQRVGLNIVMGVFGGSDSAVHIGRGLFFSIFNNAVVDRLIEIGPGTYGNILLAPAAATATNGIDLSNITFSGSAFKSAGFLIDNVGNATFSGGLPTEVFNASAGANNRTFQSQTNGSVRWNFILGNNTAEGGSNAGSDLVISNFTDAGAFIGTPLTIKRATGLTTLTSLALPVSANAAVATVLGSVGPTGSHTTVQEWIQVVGTGGAVRYVPGF